MRYSHSKFRVEIPVTAMRKKFVQAAVRDAEDSMSKKRFFATFGSLLLCVVLVYSSFFYVPGYVDLTKLVGVSTHEEKLPQKVKEPGTLDRYMNMFKVRRGYLSKGQNLVLRYDLPPGTVVTAAIGRCDAPPIIEVFHCKKIDESRFKVRSTLSGKEKFVIQKPGFYYFDEIVTLADGSETNQPYRITWSRGKGAAQTQPRAQTQRPESEKPRLKLRQGPQ